MFKTVLEYLLDGSLSLQKGCFRGNKKSKISATGKIILTLDPIYLYMGNCSNVFFSETTKLTESKIYTCIGCCFLLFFFFFFKYSIFMLTQSSKWAPPQVFVWHTTLLGKCWKILICSSKIEYYCHWLLNVKVVLDRGIHLPWHNRFSWSQNWLQISKDDPLQQVFFWFRNLGGLSSTSYFNMKVGTFILSRYTNSVHIPQYNI